MHSSSSVKNSFRFCPAIPKGRLSESLSALSLLVCISKFQPILIHGCFVPICSSTELAPFHPRFLPLALCIFLDHVSSWLFFC